MEEANKLIGTGKKHLVMGKVVEAVSVLQEACAMLADKYGDTADECGEAFLWCGKALLELARMENSVLGNALEGVPEEEESEDKANDSKFESAENLDENTRDELRVQVYDAMAEKEEAKKAEGKQSGGADKVETEEKRPKAEAEGENEGDKGAVDGKDEKEKDGQKKSPEKTSTEEKSVGEETATKDDKPTDAKEKPISQEEESAEKDSSEKQEEAAEEEEEEGEDVEMESDAEDQDNEDASAEKEEEDEVGNLQLAWEMLELAKVIYKRKESKDDQLLAAQAHLKLGEVSAESGNYGQALEDFQECLKLQLAHLDLDSRLLAETHYQLGVTFNLNSQFSEAVASFNSSASVIKSRLERLQETISKTEETLQSDKKELEELKALLPEIQEKVEDATESQKSAAAAMRIILEGASTSSAFPASGEGPSASTSAVAAASPSKLDSPNKSTSTAPVSDISHLVRKKVRPDPRKQEESPVKEGAVKKVKQDAAEEPQANGDHKVNGSNGHAAVAEVAKE